MTIHDSKINKVAKLLTDLVFLFFVVVVVERKSKGSPELRMKGRPRGWLKDNTKKECKKSVEYLGRMDVLEFSQSSSTEQ